MILGLECPNGLKRGKSCKIISVILMYIYIVHHVIINFRAAERKHVVLSTKMCVDIHGEFYASKDIIFSPAPKGAFVIPKASPLYVIMFFY